MSVSEFAVGQGAYGVTLRGAEVWTTLVHAGVVVRLADGEVERVDLAAAESRPSVIVTGPDGTLWFTRSGDNAIGRISDGVDSVVKVGGSPYGVCVGPDGAVWFTLMDADLIGRVGSDGVVTEFAIGTPGAFPALITSCGGDLWFTLNAGNAIGRMTVDGVVTTYPLPTDAAGPVGISGGPGGVWFELPCFGRHFEYVGERAKLVLVLLGEVSARSTRLGGSRRSSRSWRGRSGGSMRTG